MKTLLVTTTKTKAQIKSMCERVAQKLLGWQVKSTSPELLTNVDLVPDVMLVELSDKTRPAELKIMMRHLVHLQAQAPDRSRVVFSVKSQPRAHASFITNIEQQLKAFPNPGLVDVTFAQSNSDVATQLNIINFKMDLVPAKDVLAPGISAPRPSPIDKVKSIIDATADLRVDNGKLSADAIAREFNLSINQLATWLGRTRQALSKTPDADSLQHELSFFERVARLRAVVSKDDFLKWLRMPNAQLNHLTPLDLLAKGNGQTLADLVDDMLTGAPV